MIDGAVAFRCRRRFLRPTGVQRYVEGEKTSKKELESATV
jgi:hypothetical protein